MTRQPSKRLLSAEEARVKLEERGVSISRWAVKNGLDPRCVSDVLNGRKKGIRGEAHKAAVLLGMKQGEIVPESRMTEPLTA